MTYRRLPLEGLQNARDLGGHPVPGGVVTRYRRLIRCEAPKDLTPGDLEFLKAYGVAASIDFRGDQEVSRNPSVFENSGGFVYHRCPTFDKKLAFASGGGKLGETIDWGEKYIELLEGAKNWVSDTLRIMAGAQGAVIYNCTTGKDRSGVISALLLGLAGVAEPDIIADYTVSELYLKDVYEKLLSEYRRPGAPADLNNPFFRTKPESMSALLDYLNAKYGGIEPYVKNCGVTDREIAAIRESLVEK